MKEEKEMYEVPQCECINIAAEGVICGSGGEGGDGGYGGGGGFPIP